MDHQRAVDVLEHALFDHDDLAAAALLGRCADDADPDTELIRNGRQRDTGPNRRRRNDVVAAGVADLWQRVVLGNDRDVERPRSIGRGEGGGQARNVALDTETRLLEPLDEPAA